MSVSTKTLGFVFALTIASTIILGLYAQDANPDSAAKGFDDRKPPTKEAVGREKKNFWTDPASGNQYFVGTQDSEEPKKNSSPPASVAIPKLPPGTLRPVPLAGGQQPPAATASDRKPANPAGQFTAEVEAFVQVDLHARVAGIVEKVDVNIGDHVKKGQVLAALAVPELEAEYRQKQAGIEQARAEVEVTRCSAQATQAALATVKLRVREAEAGIQSAKAALAYRKASVERMEKLFNNKAVDQGVLDEARSKLEEAKATLDGAESRGLAARAAVDESMAQLAKTQADQKVAEAKLRVAEADLQRSAVALQYARVCAPFDGVVTRRNVDAGSFAQAPDHGKAEPLFVVARTDMVRVVIHVPDSVAPRLTKGIRATIRFDALAGQEFEAKIARVAGAIDRTNRTLRAEIDLPNTEGKILPGMYGVVSLVFEK